MHAVRRLDLGYFVRPAAEVGGPRPRAEPVLAPTGAVLARRAALEGVAQPLPDYPRWLDRLTACGPRRVLFAHDNAVWEPAG